MSKPVHVFTVSHSLLMNEGTPDKEFILPIDEYQTETDLVSIWDITDEEEEEEEE